MAKDPAFLFYPGDWQLGTMHFTLLEKGAYIELLMLQFARGKFTEAQAKHMLGVCFDNVCTNVLEKFEFDGKYYLNSRLEKEKERRSKYTESRRSNGLVEKSKKKNTEAYAKHMDTHMDKHMEDENENENVIEKESILTNSKVKKIQMPEISEILNFAKTEIEKLGHDFSKFEYPVKSKIETWQENGWKDGHNKPIKNWKAKIKNTIPFLKPMAAPQKQFLEKGLEEARANFTPSGYVPINIEKELEIARNNFVPTQYAEE